MFVCEMMLFNVSKAECRRLVKLILFCVSKSGNKYRKYQLPAQSNEHQFDLCVFDAFYKLLRYSILLY